MLKSALRRLVPAGALALLALALTPDTARAAGECGSDSSGTATCGPTSGDFDDGVTYNTSRSGGLTVNIRARENNVAREIKNIAYDSGNESVDHGHGILIYGSSGQGTLRLVVEGDTNLVRRSAPSGTNVTSRTGIRVENNSNNAPVRGSVIIETGAEVDIGKDGEPFQHNGIRAITNADGNFSGNSTAGIKITNAGKIYVDGRGIRALSEGRKISNPPRDHLNGKIEITHSGLIKAGGWGIHAVTQGFAEVAVTVEEDGTVTGGDGGIFAQVSGTGTPRNIGNIVISSAGTIDVTGGRGISIDNVAPSTGAANNTADVTVSAGTVTATDTAIHVQSTRRAGKTTITVGAGASVTGGKHGIYSRHNKTDATVDINVAGTVTGGDGANDAAIYIQEVSGSPNTVAITLTDAFRINGDILFDGKGGDTLTMNVAEDETGQVTGDVRDVTDLIKTGMGTARLAGNLAAFTGSSAEIREGLLILRGHLNLRDGTFEVKNEGRFAVEVAGDDHGRVSADTVTLANGELFVTLVSGEGEAAAREKVKNGIAIFVERDGTTPDTGLVPGTTKVKLLDDGMELGTVADGAFMGIIPGGPDDGGGDNGGGDNGDNGGGGGGSGGGGSGGGAAILVAGGALAYLLWDLGLFADEALIGSEGSGKQFGTLVRSFSSAPSGVRSGDEGIEYRVRLLEPAMPAVAAILPASGIATSLRAHLGDGFHGDLTGTQNLSASFGQDSLTGSRYGLGLGWRSGMFSTDIGYSHSPMRVQSSLASLAGLGALSGTYALRHDQVRVNAKLGLQAGGVAVSPSVSMFGGTMSQDAYTASSQVWLSEVPSISRDYAGWKAGLALRPSSDLQALGLRWRPELRLTTTRLSGDNSDAMAYVRDRAGALQFHTPVRATLPRSVHALGGALRIAGDEAWSFRGGYLASLIDNELVHAAGAQMRVQF